MTYWTDYPIAELGDKPNQIAPIRACHPLSYDGDKYVTVLVEGVKAAFKAGYLYTMPGRCGEVPTADPHAIAAAEASAS